jgi:hypothetical protein
LHCYLKSDHRGCQEENLQRHGYRQLQHQLEK